jgi:hypothetical protein
VEDHRQTRADARRSRFAKRAGVWVFLFFLVKGLAWLVIPGSAAVAAWFAR